MSPRTRRIAACVAAAVLVLPAAASAAAPSNDDRATPTVLSSLPAQATGTTVDATRATTDPFSSCGPSAGPQVWYRFTAPSDGRVVVRVQADGDLDAIVDAYLSERSQARNLTCDPTDAKGIGALDFIVKKDSEYLISISQLTNSVAGTFSLLVVAPASPPRPPGAALPGAGVNGTLDRVGNIEDSYALRMRAGHTYRMRLSGRGEDPCVVTGRLYPPGVGDYDGSSVKRFGCDAAGYATFTPGPGEGGRYSVLLSAGRSARALQGYHFAAGDAEPDDTAPGRFLSNRVTTAGALDGLGLDGLDLYRFSIARRSDLALTLKTARGAGFDLLVLNEKGRTVQCECGDDGEGGAIELMRKIAPGRYFVAVRVRDRSQGSYRLRRVSRLVTKTTVGIDRRTRLGRTAKIGVRVRPAVKGPVTVTIQRFDPLAGWLFFRQERSVATKGRASIGFVAPTVGRWRVSATFDGTIGSGPSASGFDEMLVSSPPAAG